MENQRTQKQWWAPVWKGLVMDPEAKHYRAMKNAVWLYLYLLLGANRRTGILMRKLGTAAKDMGVTRDTTLRWLSVLRKGGYVETVNTGRSLTIRVSRWKPLAGSGLTPSQQADWSRTRGGKFPTPPQTALPAIPHRIGSVLSADAAGNETSREKELLNDSHTQIDERPAVRGFTAIGAGVRQELLAQELAKGLNDTAGLSLYRSYAAKYPEWLLRKTLAEVEALPPERISKGRGALFNYLVQHHAKRINDHPGG